MNEAQKAYARAMFERALDEAERAAAKFPQPNKVLLKVAEEAGEVVKTAVHLSEGRDFAWDDLEAEIEQTMAMCIRLAVEGDGTIGLKSPLADRERQDG